MQYPLISEYIDAILSADDSMATLNNLRPVLDDRGRPVMSSGNFAVVFKMKSVDSGRCYAVKCFIKDQEGRAEAYQRISQELEFVSSPYILHVQYLEDELFVDTTQTEQEEFPVLKMEWVEGKPLDAYLRENIFDNYALEMLTYRFCRMGAFLLSQSFAHGDLKPDNILVRENGELVLVDYDGMFVPSMEGEKARELGSPDFRHPLRDENQFDSHIDDFAIASIALSLNTIALDPSLLEKYGAADRLLFSADDYRNLGESNVFKAIISLSSDSTLASLLSAFLLASAKNDLSMLSFRMFTIPMPDKPMELSSDVTDEDLVNAVEDEFGVKYSRDGLRLLKMRENSDIKQYSIKNGTVIICDFAFYNCQTLTDIIIPNSVNAIGIRAFLDCRSLLSIRIPHKIRCIEEQTFDGCVSIKSIELPNDLTTIGNHAFRNCFALQYIKIPEKVLEIGVCAFYGCIGLTSINIPDSVNSIGSHAFAKCFSLQSVNIPRNVHSVKYGIFEECRSLQSIIIPKGTKHNFADLLPIYKDKLIEQEQNTGINEPSKEIVDRLGAQYTDYGRKLLKVPDHLRTYTIKEGTETVGEYAFTSCKLIKSVNLPESITTIEKGAFMGCKSLHSIVLPENLKRIEDSAFKGCFSLTSIRIPDSVTYIGNVAFGITSLNSISIPNNIKEINGLTFCGCNSLSSISLPQNITRIGHRVFENCSSLESIDIPSSVVTIGMGCFACCDSLNSITIPDSVKTIEGCAFYKCKSLKTITFLGRIENMSVGVISECYSIKSIIIKKGTRQEFESKLSDFYKDKLVEQ